MTYFLISKTVVVEHQMLVLADSLTQAQQKALAPENHDKWRELEPRHSWMAQEMVMEEESEEYPEVVR